MGDFDFLKPLTDGEIAEFVARSELAAKATYGADYLRRLRITLVEFQRLRQEAEKEEGE